MGILYIVPTPIGNLEDITLRAIKVLFQVNVIACEDTRRTGLLLRTLQDRFAPLELREKPHPKLLSYYEENEKGRIPEIITMLKNGLIIALVSDAGTPAISDPGFKLIRECIAQKIPVESLPGASSVTLALTLSGLPTDKFLFLGYPPEKPGHRADFYKNILESQKFIKSTIILFMSPYKLLTTLKELRNIFDNIDIVICRELTKLHEEVRREKIDESIVHFNNVQPKGEFVLLFHLGQQKI